MLQYAEVDWSSPVPPPPPALNGGWYTGQAFAPGAPWATVPVVPDWSLMLHDTLRTAEDNTPRAAYTQYARSERPGNNTCANPGLAVYMDAATKYTVCAGQAR